MNIDRLKERHAKRFKKIVLSLEKIKWKTIKKIDKNYLKRNEKAINNRKNYLLKKAKTEEEKNQILTNYKAKILLLRKEYHTEKNINYHIDTLDPKGTINHLNKNKMIHKKWLVVDAAIVAALATCTVIGLGSFIFIPFVGYVCLEAIKNIECINLQNYNIKRIEDNIDTLERYKTRQVNNNVQEYGKAQEHISNLVSKNKDLVSTQDILNSIDNSDLQTLEQIKKMLDKELNKRNINENKKKLIKSREVK